MLVRLLYASRATGRVDKPLVHAILEQSRRHNPDHGITGLLCVHMEEGVFVQALEGGREAVNRLFANLVRDPRHQDVTLLHYAEIGERRFSGWRMGIVDLHKVNPGSILRYAEKTVLDPFTLSGPSALALLEDLASGAAIVSGDAP